MIGLLAGAILQLAAADTVPTVRLDLVLARHSVEAAQHRLAQANLKYSAARSGQHNKGSDPMSFLNPGSRKRWQGAVEDASAGVERAQADLSATEAAYAKVRALACASQSTIPECEAPPSP
jgi:hypothetical protein